MTSPYEREIRELHQFFEHWFHGQLPDTDATFARFADALADGFEMVTPDGSRRARADVLSGLRGAFGVHAAETFSIEIRDVRVEHESSEQAFVTYLEVHHARTRELARRSCVLFQREPSAPGGLLWRFVQETWDAEGL